MKYLIVIQETTTDFVAHAPDFPGLTAGGYSRETAERAIADSIAGHLQGLKNRGIAVPEPRSSSSYVEFA